MTRPFALLIEVNLLDHRFLHELFGNPRSLPGAVVSVPFGGFLKLGLWDDNGAGAADVVTRFVLNTNSVESKRIAAWVCQTFRGKIVAIKINRIDVRLDQGEVERVVEAERKG